MRVWTLVAGFVMTQSQLLGQGSVVTSAEIEKMLIAKISDGIIVSHVRQSGSPVTLSIDEIINLKKQGASDSLIESIMSAAPAIPGKSAASVGTKLELGVYAKKGESWSEIATEVVNFKSSSPFKAYTFRMDLNGRINGGSSRTTLKTPIAILLITPEGVNANEYQLVRLRSKDTQREFRMASSGIGGTKSGVERDAVAFDFKKLGPGQFTIDLPSSVVAGEYAFLPPMGVGGGGLGGPGASLGKAYTFRVLE